MIVIVPMFQFEVRTIEKRVAWGLPKLYRYWKTKVQMPQH